MSANAQEYFASSQHQEPLDQACSLSVIEGFDNHPSTAIAQEYVDCLAKHGVDGLKKQLIVDRGVLNTSTWSARIYRRRLTCETRCKFVLRPPFNTESPSENDCLHIWTSVFDVIMDKISLHTRDDVGGLEGYASHVVAGTRRQFKRAEIGERDLAIQNRKNVRLARCIQQVHASLGVEDPSIFMADASLEAQAPIVQLAKELHEVEHEKANFTRAIHRNRASTPPPVQRRFQDHVLFTPQKKRPRAKTQDD
ncbi:hypothetical protein BG006_003123 [Podila minutissima]|uniref:Uncharacterized protein n=1 Tax=Podila minutissima TaxID=64525 RepID=A0A9P5S8K3_9FUNG|nr:hypothetical protein BG006_003123 [Podila minutissima]